MKRSEAILAYRSCDELYSSHHQQTIVQLLPIEEQLKRARMTCKGFESFNDIKSQFENIFVAASMISNNSNELLDSHGQSMVHNDDMSRTITENYAMVVDNETDQADSNNL